MTITSTALRCTIAPNTSAVRRDGAFPEGGAATLALALARQEDETAQLVLRVAAAAGPVAVTTEVTPLRHPDGHVLAPDQVRLYVPHYIEVTRPSTPTAAPGWYPDALVPLDATLSVPAEANQSLWLKVSAPAGQPAGDYHGELILRTPGGPATVVPVQVRVWDFEVPVAGHARSAFALWYHQVAEHFGVPQQDPDYWAMAERYYWFQVGFRIPPDDLPIPVDLPVPEYVDRAARFLDSPAVNCFRIPFFPDDVDRSRQLVEALRARGWLQRGYFYCDDLDEPTTKDLPRLRERARILASIAPEVPHLVTTEPRVDLPVDGVSWVPLFDRLDPDRVAELRTEGRQVWWYGCVIPTDPWPNYHLDGGLEGARLLPWMQHRYGVDGNLYWSTTVFGKYDGSKYGPRDVWRDPVAYPGASGDGFLLYPGPDRDAAPYATLRLETIREGVEDYEYLCLLDELTGSAARRFGVEDADWASAWLYHDRLWGDLRRQTWRPERLPEVRAAVAERILALQGDLPTLVRVSPAGGIELVAPPGTVVELDGARLGARDEDQRRVRITADLPACGPATERRFTVTCHRDGRSRSETVVVPAVAAPPPARPTARLWPDRQPADGAGSGEPVLPLGPATGDRPRWHVPDLDGGFDRVVALVANPTADFRPVRLELRLTSGTTRTAAEALLAPERRTEVVAELDELGVRSADVHTVEVIPRPAPAGAPADAPLQLVRLVLYSRADNRPS